MTLSEEYAEIGAKLIKKLPEFAYIKNSNVNIAYLSSNQAKKKGREAIVHADCNRASNRYDWCCPADFFIVVYEPNIVEFNVEQIETLIRHELHHVGIRKDSGGEHYYIRPHDLEDFRIIVEECGVDWDKQC